MKKPYLPKLFLLLAILVAAALTTVAFMPANVSADATPQLGTVDLFSASASASMSVQAVGECEGGWQLQCTGGTCCTVCQATGEIGDCGPAQQMLNLVID